MHIRISELVSNEYYIIVGLLKSEHNKQRTLLRFLDQTDITIKLAGISSWNQKL